MENLPIPSSRIPTASLAALRERVTGAERVPGDVLPFELVEIDAQLANHGLDCAGLHEICAVSATLNDDASATLFAAGIAARFANKTQRQVLWTLTTFDLYAPGLEQVGLAPDAVFYAQGRKDCDVLAMAEDALRDGSLACVIAEVKSADRTATRRLQLAASEGRTPILLYRRHRASGRCPLSVPSSAMTRWRIGCLPSARPAITEIGRARWSVELVRQRNGHPFSFELEACDDTGRLALPAAAPHRAIAPVGATNKAA